MSKVYSIHVKNVSEDVYFVKVNDDQSYEDAVDALDNEFACGSILMPAFKHVVIWKQFIMRLTEFSTKLILILVLSHGDQLILTQQKENKMRLAKIIVYSDYGNYKQKVIENVNPYSICLDYKRNMYGKRVPYVSYDWYLEGNLNVEFHSYFDLPDGYQFSVFAMKEVKTK